MGTRLAGVCEIDNRIIHLNWYEVYTAAMIGVMRNVCAEKDNKRRMNNQPPEDTWRDHIIGALGEQALAKYLGIYWEATVNAERGRVDVGRYEVKATHHRNGCIIVSKNQATKTNPYALVIGAINKFRVVGWIHPPASELIVGNHRWRELKEGRGYNWVWEQDELIVDFPEKAAR